MRTVSIATGVIVTVALGIALHGDPLIGLGVSLLAGLAYIVGYLDGSVGR